MDFVLENQYYRRRHMDYREDDKVLDNYPFGISLVSEGVVRKEAFASTREHFEVVKAIVSHFIRHPDPTIVPVYDFKAIEVPTSKYGAHKYYYDMMRMKVLNVHEKKLISDVADDYWRHRNSKQTFLMDNWMASNAKLADFLRNMIEVGRYHDLHNGNIMKDMEDNYRIIDLEGFQLMPLNQPANDWITRE